MLEHIKSHFRENKVYWLVMFISFLLLVTYFNDDIKSSLRMFLSWTFAAATYKIFIEDLTIDMLKHKDVSLNGLSKASANGFKTAVNGTAVFYEKIIFGKKKIKE